MIILFKCCEIDNTQSGVPRPRCVNSKTDLIKKTFISVLTNNSHVSRIVVFGDGLRDELILYFKEKTPLSIELEILNTFTLIGSRENFVRMLEYANKIKDDQELVYFLEDDYIHDYKNNDVVFSTVNEIMRDFPNCFFHPTDYPDRYMKHESHHVPVLLILSKFGYFREVKNLTFTFLCKVGTLKNHYEFFRFCVYEIEPWEGMDGVFSCIFKGTEKCHRPIPEKYKENRGICFSPIPSLSAHFHLTVLPPFLNWENIYNSIII